MSTEIAVLRALLRLSRRRAPATFSELVDRVTRETRDATADDVQHALASFARAQLVQRTGDQVRLSLAGLAVAVAAVRHAQTQARRRAKTVAPRQAPFGLSAGFAGPQARTARTARVFPLIRTARTARTARRGRAA